MIAFKKRFKVTFGMVKKNPRGEGQHFELFQITEN